MVNTTRKLNVPTNVPAPREERLLFEKANRANLDVTSAFTGEIICTIYCEGGNKYEVLLSEAGTLLVANAQKQLGEEEALFVLPDNKNMLITKSGELMDGDTDRRPIDNPDVLLRLTNKSTGKVEGKRHRFTAIESNPTKHNKVVSEHFTA